jgi:hypothetical protein
MALNRRFGARETRAGNWKAFAATILGSELIVSDDSNTCPVLDVSSLFFYWLRKTSACRPGSGSGEGCTRFAFSQPDISAVQKSIDV